MKKMMIFCMTMVMAVTGMAQNVRTHMDKLRDMAAQDNGKAQMVLAKHYVDGDSLPVNYMTAVHWYSQAFKNGKEKAIRKEFQRMAKKNPEKYYDFLKFMEGNVEMFVYEDYWRAFEIYTDGYVKGVHPNELLVMMVACIGADVDESELNKVLENVDMDSLKTSLMQSSPMIQMSLAVGHIERGDTAQAISMMEKISLAGIPFASDFLGKWYLLCKKPHYDIDKAIAHFKHAERNKVLSNANWFAFCYEHELGGLKYDEKRVKKLKEMHENKKDHFHQFSVWLDNEGF